MSGVLMLMIGVALMGHASGQPEPPGPSSTRRSAICPVSRRRSIRACAAAVSASRGIRQTWRRPVQAGGRRRQERAAARASRSRGLYQRRPRQSAYHLRRPPGPHTLRPRPRSHPRRSTGDRPFGAGPLRDPHDRGDLLRQNQDGLERDGANEQANKDDKPFLVDDARQRLIDEVDRLRTRKEQKGE